MVPVREKGLRLDICSNDYQYIPLKAVLPFPKVIVLPLPFPSKYSAGALGEFTGYVPMVAFDVSVLFLATVEAT